MKTIHFIMMVLPVIALAKASPLVVQDRITLGSSSLQSVQASLDNPGIAGRDEIPMDLIKQISFEDLKALLALKEGSTREEFSKVFEPCGLTTPSGGVFRHRKYKELGIKVTFEYTRWLNGQALFSPGDKIATLSGWYYDPVSPMD